ncbi:hypothetical protein SLA2020_204710 [Shorea laevis]
MRGRTGVAITSSKEEAQKQGNSIQVLVEQERSTQPFWEGLASNNEILQARAERFAWQKRRKAKAARIGKTAGAKRKASRKEGKSSVKLGEVGNLEGEIFLSQVDKGVRARNWRAEAEELWEVGK